MGWRSVLGELAAGVSRNSAKLLQALPENLTTRSNAVKTKDLRIDVHQDSKNPNKAVARIQANYQAQDQAVKDFIKSGNKGHGHKGTHKIIAEIPFDRSNFDLEDFLKKILGSR